MRRSFQKNKPAFIILDEFQKLAKAKCAGAIIAALRTSLDKRADGLVAVFTGSSREGLKRIFSERDAPFFRFATPVDLPPMGTDFVNHQLKAFRGVSEVEMDKNGALDVFDRFDGNPMFFQRWLMKIALNPEMSENDAIDAIQTELAEEFGFNETWLGLSSNQRIVARLLADRVERTYGASGGEFIGKLSARAPPPKSAMQAAVGRLSRLGIVDRRDGNRRIGDPLFESWIRNRPASEF